MSATITDNPIRFNYTGKNGYTSTITYSYVPGSTSQISLYIDTSVTSPVTPVVISIAPKTLPDGVVSSSYTSTTLVATGGSSPYTYTVNNTPNQDTLNGKAIYYVNSVANTGSGGTVTYKSGWAPTKNKGFNYQDPVIIVASPNGGHTFTNWTVLNADGTPFNDIDTSVANQVSFYMPPNNVTVIGNFDGNTSTNTNYVLPGGLPAGLTLNASTGVIAGTPTVTGSFAFTITAADSNGIIGFQTYTINVRQADRTTVNSYSAAPVFPTPTADNQHFRYIRGISVVAPSGRAPNNAISDFQALGVEFVTTNAQPIIASLVEFNGGVIPKGTTFTLNSVTTNTVVASAYSAGDITNLTLYYIPPYDTQVFTAVVNTDNNGYAWEAITTLSATGTGRIIQGSNNTFVFGPDVGNNGAALYAGGNANNTYIRSADIVNITDDNIVQSASAFTYRVIGQSFNNPYYGALISNVPNTPYGTEMGYAAINASTASTPYGSSVKDVVIEFSVVDALVQTPGVLTLFTPYTFALTGQSVWLQTVPPFYLTPNGYSSYSVNWGDGIVETFTNTAPTSAFFFTHSYTVANDTPYTVTVSAYDSSNTFQQATSLSSQFYIQNSFPEINLDDFAKTLGVTPVLPYSQSNVRVGSNEWATADVINASLTKLDSNFSYLNTIVKTIRRAPQFELVQWLEDFIQYPTWNGLMAGTNQFTPLSSTYNFGVAPGTIHEFRSYKSPYSAPDYYQYITYTVYDTYSTVEVRKNDFKNSLVLTLSSIIPNSLRFKTYSVDVSGTNLYLLGHEVASTSTSAIQYISLYRFALDYNAGQAYIVNQIGGAPGSILDNYNFGWGGTTADIPTDIKVYNNKVYVGDKSNKCVKIYNSSLTYKSTIYNSKLMRRYDIATFDVDQTTNKVFMFGTLKNPNPPVITSISTSAVNTAQTQYTITWNHDGNRLASTYDNVSANFVVYGQTSPGGTYTLIDAFLNPYIVNLTSTPKLTTYVFTSSLKYINFRIRAIGKEKGFDSALSSPIVTPNKNAFPSPYKVFVFNEDTNGVSYRVTPQVPPTANIIKLLVEPSGVYYYVVTDSYIYKYTTTGLFVNRINNPSYESGSLNEPITDAFIDDRYYFYITTPSRVFKFIDLPSDAILVNEQDISNYYSPLSSYLIGENELVQDWVYNRTIDKVINNHDILAKGINGKYILTIDKDNNIVTFDTRPLSGNEIITSLSATESSYIHRNEIVSSAVINRFIDNVYSIQQNIINSITPQVVVNTPSGTANVLGQIAADQSAAYVYYQYIQPAPYVVTQPIGASVYTGSTVTLTVSAGTYSEQGQSALSYQWYLNNTAIEGANASTYSITEAALTDAGSYYCIVTDNAGSVTTDAVTLAVALAPLFSFNSIVATGNLYSPLNGGIPARYGNDYVLSFKALNMPSTAKLKVAIHETNGSSWNFTNTVYATINQGSTPIETSVINTSAYYVIPLSSYLTTTSDTVQPDGYSNTYASSFSIALSIGSVTTSVVTVPRVHVSLSDGTLYDATFTNGLSGANMSSGSLTVNQLSGNSITYAAITNNSLGGYVGPNSYIRHNWVTDGALSGTNPIVNTAPASTASSTLSATRFTTGETEVTYTYSRTVGTGTTVPSYTITANANIGATSSSGGGGAGYFVGGGTYSAGSLATINAIGTYLKSGAQAPGVQPGSPLVVTGPGIYDAGTINSTGKLAAGPVVDPNSNSSAIMEVYVDGNKTITGYFVGP